MNQLPQLRNDLRLQRGGTGQNGSPLWVVHDPVANSYFEVGFEMLQLLSLWNESRSAQELVDNVARDYGRVVDNAEIMMAFQMLVSNQFIDVSMKETWQHLHALSQKKHPWYVTAFHSYLFFKVPLLQPQAFLKATWPVARLFFNRWFFSVSAILGLIGLFFVSRQWDQFTHSVPYLFTFEGAIISVLAIVLVKSLHEMGHAYMAYRYGCHVPTMGLAFMTFVPMLYTDITDAWKLTSRRERLMIDSAGIQVELVLGMLCLFLWSFLPDGALRSAVFVTATVSWVMSLMVNLSPLMRFDGYFIFSDFLGMPNLHTRTFAHFRYRLRRFLFGIDEEPAERFSWKMDLFLVCFAIAIIIYRFSLYIGIALLVYHFIVKLVGIGLFISEVGFFMIMPVWKELKHWWSMRGEILSGRRVWITVPAFVLACGFLFVPVSSTINAPAVLEPENFQRLFSPEAGQVAEIRVTDGQTVNKDDVLFVILSPKLENQKVTTKAEIAVRERRLARIASDNIDLEQRQVLQQELKSLHSKLDGLENLEKRLTVKAEFAGTVTDVSNRLYKGRSISRSEQLGVLIGGEKTVSRGYVSGNDIARVSPDSKALFIPDDVSSSPVPLRLSAISQDASDSIDLQTLASVNGGRIAVNQERDRLTPVASEYAVKAESRDTPGLPSGIQRGILKIDAEKASLAGSAWVQIAKVLVRESGI